MSQRRVFVLALLLLAACSKESGSGGLDPAVTAPRRVKPPEPKRGWKVSYRLDDESSVSFELKGRGQRIGGRFTRVDGDLVVDLMDLEETRGTIRVDLTSVEITSSAETDDDERWTAEALRWLNQGASRPKSERDRDRFAVVEITSARTKTSAAHDAKLVSIPKDRKTGHGEELEESDETLPEPEARELRVVLGTDLTLQGHRVAADVSIDARLEYDAPALSGAVPTRIVATTRRPLPVSLETHGIGPRDDAGIIVSKALPLLGKAVGRVALTNAVLVARTTR